MAKVKLELQKKTDSELKVFCENHVSLMVDNPNFSTPSPTVANYAIDLNAFNAALSTVDGLESQLAQARVLLAAAREKLELATTSRGNYVESESMKDPAKILSAGFEVKAAGAPVGELPAPINFLAKMGTMPGQIGLTWKKIYGAGSYEVECREHDMPGIPWERVKTVTAAKLKVENLTPGKNYAFRVRAIGAAGEGPWSDETVKMAP